MIIIYNFYDIITDYDKAFRISDEVNPSVTEVSLTNNPKDIQDGLYVIDRGNGWVTGKKEDILVQTAGSPGPVTITLDYEVEYQNKIIIESKASFGFNISFITAMLELTLEKSTTVKNTTVCYYSKSIPQDKTGFGLLYMHYNRHDIIKIKNKQVIDHAINYKTTGVHPIFVEYPTGSTINTKDYLYRSSQCLFNPKKDKIQLPDISSIPIEDAKIVSFPLVYNTKEYTDLSEYVYVYFRPISSGTYKISTNDNNIFYLYLSDFNFRNQIELLGAYNLTSFKDGTIYIDLNSNNLYLMRIKTKIYGTPGITTLYSKATFKITRVTNSEKILSPIILYNLDRDHVLGVSLLFNSSSIKNKIAFRFINPLGISKPYVYSRNGIYKASLYEIANSVSGTINFINDYEINGNYTYLNTKSNSAYIIVLSLTGKSNLNEYLHFYIGGY